MIQLNKVIIAGNVTHDPELRKTPRGVPVCNFSIALNRKFQAAGGQWKEETSFIEIKAWNRTAELAAEYLGKGVGVIVDGYLKQERWESSNGSGPKTKVVVHAENLNFLGYKDGKGPRRREKPEVYSGSGDDF